MLSKAISTDTIVDMVKKQCTLQTRAREGLLHSYTDVQLKSIVEQILQICSNNSNTPPQLNKHDVMWRSEQFCTCSNRQYITTVEGALYCCSCYCKVEVQNCT